MLQIKIVNETKKKNSFKKIVRRRGIVSVKETHKSLWIIIRETKNMNVKTGDYW